MLPIPISQCIEALRTAADERAVHMLLTSCMSELAGDLGALPEEAKALIADRETEVHDIAVGLLQAELAFKGDERARKLLWEVAHLFAGAASRIGHIRSRIHRQRA